MRAFLYLRRALVALIGLSLAATASAQLIEVRESGSNVIATASGSFNIAGATLYGGATNTNPSNLAGNLGVARVGTYSDAVDVYALQDTFATFGTMGSNFATTTEGVGFGVSSLPIGGFNNLPPGTPVFLLPAGYSTGNLIATATWANSTIASLGLTPGTYTTLFNDQTVTLRILPGVPEPATWAMMLIGFGAIGAAMRRRGGKLALA